MSKEDVKPYTLSAEEVVSHLNTDASSGLSDAEVQRRLEQYGHNELITEEKTTLLQKFIAQFKDFMIIVLLVAAAVSAVIGVIEGEGIADAVVILIVVILNAVMGVFQESKAEEAIDALKDMASPEATVRRNNANSKIKSTELVPGDIVLLEAGDIVPADLRLIESSSLQIEEAALTGESVPSEKSTEIIADPETGIGDRKNMAFSSTNVTYGRAKGVVIGTGMNTEVGNIANILSTTESQQTPLQRDQEELGKKLTYLIIIIAVITFFVGLFGPNAGDNTVIDMLLISISLAVAAIPEGLPAITTIILSIGTQKMAERNALVRTLPAVETLGSTQVICSDKTGTLTVNKMTIEKVYYNGELHEASEDIDLDTPLLRSITFANDVNTDNAGNLVGDPTEIAMIKYANDKGFDLEAALEATPRIDEVPFDSSRKLMSTIHQLEDGKYLIAAKGAPDQLIKRVTQYQDGDQVIPFTQEHSDTILAANDGMARNALRVLAGAYKIVDSLPEKVDSESIENDLIFAGLVGMIDPERQEAGEAIKVARNAGIRTVMITGDHAVTAQAIAERLGILNPDEDNSVHVTTGAELDKMSDEELTRTVSNYSVYARVSPEHKVRIIRAWQANDVVVAMTGDGVNDAPSLKQADIGVGMGITGTEVSKGASDMVLADDNFETIVVAVEEGRKVFANIQKAVQFLLSANMGEVITLFVATFMGWTILEPIHILWINLVTDVFPAIALGMENAEKDSMTKAPRTRKDNFLSFGVLPSIFYQGILEGGITLFVYWVGHYVLYPHDNNIAETMAFITLGMIQLFHSYNVKSTFKSMFSSNPFDNKYLNLAFIGSGALLLGVILIPGINTYFDVTLPTASGWAVAIIAAISIIPLVEIIKWILRTTGVAAKYEKPGSENVQ
ncbi:cation-translocating P-type ATPase [Fundicoccus culcitae]|uniref:Cation-translocating P-type ATPase n=1 Tax=Fundicoccus culcitae TaxID=2969821 RepID=A0ABY5P5Y9_9LACT|nr:cation-translocating P-type ATPase [Fundicoccus culcitae]UUX33795.1 cation-translocating P-type ATPase [Fundicoccus culcitae]